MIRLKICGMRDEENIREVISLSPDLMGFIFYKNSPRYAGDYFKVPSVVSKKTGRTGVFVDAPMDEILKRIEDNGLSHVQLHGNETTSLCDALRKRDVKVIKVFGVGSGFDFRVTEEFEKSADYFLFDTKGENHGGNGIVFDWSILTRYKGGVPFFLSGGLSLKNIKEALSLKAEKLCGFDLNSGVETSPGVKNPGQIRAIMDLMNYKKTT